MSVASILFWKNRKLAFRKSRCSLCCQFVLPIAIMILLIVFKTLIDAAQGVKCTTADRNDDSTTDCDWNPFVTFLSYDTNQFNSQLWFADAANQCSANGIRLYYAPAGNAEVSSLMTTAAQYMQDQTPGSGLTFSAIGVASISAIPIADVSYPQDGCTFFVDFTATCTDASSTTCEPWQFVVRPSFVPGGYNDESSYEDQRSWYTEEDKPCFNPRVSLGARSYEGDSAGNLDQYGSDPGYPNHGFIAVQHGITVSLVNSSSLDPLFLSASAKDTAFARLESIELQRMAFPEYYLSFWAAILPSFLAFFTLWFSSVAVIVGLVSDMVIEKELKLTITMKLMGLTNSEWRSSWMKRGLIGYTPLLLGVSLLGMVRSVIPASFVLSFCFLVAFGLAAVCYAFLVTSLSRVSTTAVLYSIMGWFLAFLPWVVLFLSSQTCITVSRSAQGAMCLLAPSCMGLGVEVFTVAAYTDNDATWANAADDVEGDKINMVEVIFLLLFDALWMYLLAVYLENVMPGEFGTPESLLFPLYIVFPSLKGDNSDISGGGQPSNATVAPTTTPPSGGGARSKARVSVAGQDVTTAAVKVVGGGGGGGGRHGNTTTTTTTTTTAVVREPYGADTTDETFGIELNQLTKIYPPRGVGGHPFLAVNDLTLKMRRGEVTALLGQNGAGKSTTMNMLCGLYTATQGDMHMNGYDIQTTGGAAYRRKHLGVCPQHDVLWNMLTVWEHLVFFASVKGMSRKEAERSATSMLQELALVEKRDTYAKDLSGGQKRRLSVAIAMIGGSSVVVLDEPTSGVDPQSARQIWEMIEANKHQRTVLLSTHSMEEADVLADRIAIIANGTLKCDGSSMFLKNTYGVGYTLTIAKDPGCDADKIANVVTESIEGAEVTTNVGTELQIKLPREEAGNFASALRQLEQGQEDLKIDSMGISVTTLEEVFLRVVMQDVEVDPVSSSGRKSSSAPHSNRSSNNHSPVPAQSSESDAVSPPARNATESVPIVMNNRRGNGTDNNNTSTTHGTSTYTEQVKAIVAKNVMVLKRQPIFMAALLTVPLFFMLFGAFYIPDDSEFDPLADAPLRILRPDGTVLLATTSSSDCTTGLCDFARTSYLPSQGVTSQATSNITTYIYSLSSSDATDFNDAHQLGFSFDNDVITAMFNGQYYHTVAIALRTAAGLILSNATTSSFSDLTVSNFPLTKTATQSANAGSPPTEQAAFWAIMNAYAQVIFTALLVARPIRERASNAKLMQLVSGASYRSYWAGFFVIDYALGMFLTIVTVIILCGPSNGPIEGDLGGALFLLGVLFYAAVLPQVYVVSCLMTTPAYGFSVLFLAQYFLNLIPSLFGTTCSVDPGSWACDAQDAFYWVPMYAFTNGQNNLFLQSSLRRDANDLATSGSASCTTQDDCCELLDCGSTFGWKSPGIGRDVLSLVCMSIFFWVLLSIMETNSRGLSWFETTPTPTGTDNDNATTASIDPDVKEEEERVLQQQRQQQGASHTGGGGGGMGHNDASTDDDRVLVSQLRKSFGAKRAVDGISFGVPPRACFGLLGVNGAGKTTTFKMITGEHRIGAGTIRIAGYDVKTQLLEVQRRIGYVPQFDALVSDLNAKELLAFYASLRGIPSADIPDTVERLIDQLDLRKHCDRRCGTYSGGNKRKLSVACALIGDPDILLLDEPTTGMDPGGKRYLWNVVLGLVKEGRSIVLTSHSMEECEALCTTLTIMVDGTMRCFGSVQHLKVAHGSGYIIRVTAPEHHEGGGGGGGGAGEAEANTTQRTTSGRSQVSRTRSPRQPNEDANIDGGGGDIAQMDAAVKSVLRALPQAEVKDVYGGSATLHLKDPKVKISALFEALESLKQSGEVKEYAVGQASLESIFRTFAKRAAEQQTVSGGGGGGPTRARSP